MGRPSRQRHAFAEGLVVGAEVQRLGLAGFGRCAFPEAGNPPLRQNALAAGEWFLVKAQRAGQGYSCWAGGLRKRLRPRRRGDHASSTSPDRPWRTVWRFTPKRRGQMRPRSQGVRRGGIVRRLISRAR